MIGPSVTRLSLRLVVALCLLLTATVTGVAEAQRYTVISPSGIARIRIAIPYCRGLGGSLPVTLEQEIAQVLADDLEFSGYFKRLDPIAYLEDYRKADLEAGAFNYDDWTIIGAEYLLKTGAELTGEVITIEARLYDLFGRRQILGKRLTGRIDERRALLHRFANLALKEVTGEEGVFDTWIACEVKTKGGKDLFILDYDGENPRKVVSNGNLNLMPDWSPDGKYIAFTSYLKANPDLFVLDLQRAMIKRISRRAGVNMSPDWSPDGSQIALTMTRGSSTDIYVMNRNGTDRRQLTRELGVAVGPTWSPDGKQIAFISDRTGTPQLYVIDVARRKNHRLSFDGAYFANPEWSPDGQRIAYAKVNGAGFDIYTIRADGTHVQLVTDAPGSHEHPSWSPNGSYLVYQTTRHAQPSLYIQNVRTGDRRRITPPNVAATSPSWGPAQQP
ncbi:MAG: Tol-Pal system beta propeller repeat protein TolB [Nitrospirota bacterium]